jgi:hypothetical protein
VRNLVGAGLALIALTSTGAASDQAGDRRRDTIRSKEGRLGVDVQGRTLEWVLGQISRAANVAFVTDETLPETTVSVQFGDVPLDEGIRRILKDQDTFFFYEAQGNAPSTLRVVWV